MPVLSQAGEAPLFAPVPDWVIDAGTITPTQAKIDGLILLDRQQKVDGDRTWTYSDLAFRATSTEQLAGLGNVTLNWHPDKGDLIIHRLEIIRGDQIIDVTKGANKFTVLRREQNLERQWISGILSATMQIEGLKVGDILRMATSISFADPALAGNVEFSLPLIVEPAKVGQSALRMIWPQDRSLKWRVTVKDTPVTLTKRGKYNELLIPQPMAKLPDYPASAPLRFAPPVIFEASSFSSWEAVSKSTAPLYVTEGLIPAGSGLAERVSKIAASTTDPKLRAAAALRMVQDDIRYLFSGQTQGNYVPQKPMETWEKRYGDCKAKTMLLTAMLRSLGIEAEPALVSSQLGDILQSRLPALGAFDHVLVRAVIEGKIYWLDGTLLGTRLADLADPPTFGYALPIRAGGSGLEKINYVAPARPLVVVDKDVDASAGIALPKPYKLTLTFRNANVAYFRQAQANMAPKKLDETIDQTIQQWFPESVIASRALSFDDEAGTVRISAEGITNLSWDQVDDRRVMSLDTIMSNFDLSVDRSRPAWKEVPVATNYPNAYEFRYRLHLPQGGKGFTLENPKSVTGRFGGYDMTIASKLEGGVFEQDEAWKTSELEVPAAILPAERERIARAKGEPIRVVAPADYPQSWRERRLVRGTGLLKRLDALYAANIAQDPAETQGYDNRARYLDGIDDKPRAISDLTKILSLQPSAETYLWRARLYKDLDPKKALADIESARAIDPASAAVAFSQVEIFLKQRRYDEAVAAIDSALPLQTNRTGMLVLKAEVLARAGKAEEALAVINKANLDKPGNPDLLNGRCWVRAIANVELDSALKDCTKAIELSEHPAGMLDSRGMVYFRLQRYDDALADLDAALRLSPEMSPTLYVRSVVQSWKGATAASMQDLKDAQTIQPDVADQYIRIGVKPKS